MKILYILLLLLTVLSGEVIKIATYNVDNLFDLNNDGREYEEYIPYGNNKWDDKAYKAKIDNISRVISELKADIIALQEVESREALKDLRFAIKQKGLYYEYYDIADQKNTTVKVAILSKYPFLYTKELYVSRGDSFRNILEAKLKINNKDMYIFINHWNSKKHPESSRIISAKTLIQRVEEIGLDKNIVLLGDFNSDYEECIKFKKDRHLNDTFGKTGINHTLQTLPPAGLLASIKSKIGFKEEQSLYNLWYNVDESKRYSYIYKSQKEALDNIIVSKPMLKYYQNGSISNFNQEYLFKKNKIFRWEMTKSKEHKAKGFSDHLPIYATFILE